MAIRAKRSGVASAGTGVSKTSEGVTKPVEKPKAALSPVPTTPPAGATPATVANAMVDLNAGVLDNIDDINIGGNYVTVDGTQFLYKATNETADTIDIVVSYGKRFYQWYDEENETHHNSDTKLDDRYKLKFEIRWFEQGEDDEEPKEYIMTLSTTSALNFIEYVKTLSRQGLAVNQVVTRMSISRQVSRDGKNRYSRVEFEAVDVLQKPESVG